GVSRAHLREGPARRLTSTPSQSHLGRNGSTLKAEYRHFSGGGGGGGKNDLPPHTSGKREGRAPLALVFARRPHASFAGHGLGRAGWTQAQQLPYMCHASTSSSQAESLTGAV
ncbi:unnamed protein product, partial [Discosporangium mesarthrocarpum]